MADGRGRTIAHISALDGARGMAVAGVLLFHGGHLTGGYLGVDFFFVLSGFLITSLLLAEADRTGGIGLGGFWARRARRLLPALCVLMVGIALYCVAFADATQLAQIRGDAFATLGYVANWREVFAHQNYFDLFTTPSPLNHTWSLAIEEQFYLAWPLLFVAVLARAKRRTPQAVFTVALVLAGVSTALMIGLFDPSNPSRVYFGTDTRATAILLGAALAAWNVWHPATDDRRRRAGLEGAGIAGAIVLAVAWVRVDGQSSSLYHGGFLLYGLAATAVIAAVVHPRPGPLSRALSFPPICALGLISYGVYLYHWPIDVALDSKQMGFSGWPLFLFQTVITLAVATISFHVIERPIRRGAIPAVQWRRLTPALAVALVIALVASTDAATPGPSYASVSFTAHPLATAIRAYRQTPPGAQRVLLVGDSVALTIGPSFQGLRGRPMLSVLDAGIPGCTFPPGLVATRIRLPNGSMINPSPCNPSWLRDIVDRYKPDVVLWMMAGTRTGTYHGERVNPCSPEYGALFRTGMTAELAMFRNTGARVVITTAAFNRATYLSNTDESTNCDNHLRRVNALSNHAQLVDLFAYMCPGGKCRVKQNGVLLRSDGLHYSGPGGTIVARWLVSQIFPNG